MKTAELTGAQLDYWVAKAEGIEFVMRGDQPATEHEFSPEGPANEYSHEDWKMWRYYRPSLDWAQGGPIIERERINVLEVAEWSEPGVPPDHWRWTASLDNDTGYYGFTGNRQEGPTPLIAAMRAYVASKFGEEVAD